MLQNALRLERMVVRNLTISSIILNNRRGGRKYTVVDAKKDSFCEDSDPNVFGTLSREHKFSQIVDKLPEEDDDRIEVNYLDNTEGKTRLRTKQYADMIKKCVLENRISDALDVLETKMLKEDRVKPENYIYNLLIAATANVGYTKKAFQLFNQMKKRGLKVTGATYTSLFNACAKSPWKSDGLTRATHIRDLINQNAYVLNQSNYHAMIKAFGHCGDISTAFSLVDEMISNSVPVTSETINFLLQACISDKETGFRHALIVWQKMIRKKITPSLYTYNLMLRCVRDCGLGDLEVLKDDLQSIVEETKGLIQPQPVIAGGDRNKSNEIDLKSVYNLSKYSPINFLAAHPIIGADINALKRITKPRHRLMLLGGCKGFFDQMALSKVKPDIKTITQMLDVIPSVLQEENLLLDIMAEHGIHLDIDFCNMLIKKRWRRNCSEEAKDVLNLIRIHHLTPNIITYGVLALSCKSSEEIDQLLKDINENGLRVNIEILGSLLKSAIHMWDVSMVLKLMDEVLKEELKPNQHFMNHLKNFHDFVQAEIKIKEKGGHAHKKIKDRYFMEGFKMFCYRYKGWKNLVALDDSDSVHPWKQFRGKEGTQQNIKKV